MISFNIFGSIRECLTLRFITSSMTLLIDEFAQRVAHESMVVGPRKVAPIIPQFTPITLHVGWNNGHTSLASKATTSSPKRISFGSSEDGIFVIRLSLTPRINVPY